MMTLSHMLCIPLNLTRQIMRRLKTLTCYLFIKYFYEFFWGVRYIQFTYSMLLKAEHDELIHPLITLHNHESILRLMAIMRSQLKNEEEIFCSSPRFEPWSPSTVSQYATNELC